MVKYFVPFEQVGEFKLGTPINDYLKSFSFTFSEKDTITEWETYELQEEGLELYVENGLIVSICCRDECIYKGRNMIGMGIDEFLSAFSVHSSSSNKIHLDDDESQFVYDIDEMGLQVWSRNGRIVTAIVN
ncbi:MULTISPECIES: hypothetical protein [unclassified Flavobacterium]|uniref:hypothetical protein n=1 Tax=unclassified Flavobacterium TaxID=196869 RepID=UPI001F131D6E|nr:MULTISPECIES: hypothetical protein [unclassified Flavobacterium]UMY65276.1 hypothetical protein MKO97_12300 [Flavobacterium sp. HJ-32-4]